MNKYDTQQSRAICKLLIERIEQNFADFMDEVLLLDKEEIFESAHRIADVTDTYVQLIEGGFRTMTDSEAMFLLKFHNPLEMIADFLSDRAIEEDVDDAIADVINAVGLEDSYLTYKFADELREKYGTDENIKIALLEEVISAGLRYMRLMQMADNATANIPCCYDSFFDFEDDEEGCF